MRFIARNGVGKLTSSLVPCCIDKMRSTMSLVPYKSTMKHACKRDKMNTKRALTSAHFGLSKGGQSALKCTVDKEIYINELVSTGMSEKQASVVISFLEAIMNHLWESADGGLARRKVFMENFAKLKEEISLLKKEASDIKEFKVKEIFDSMQGSNEQISRLEANIKKGMEKVKNDLSLDINLDVTRRESELSGERDLVLAYFKSLNQDLNDISKRITAIRENTRFYVCFLTSILILTCLFYRYFTTTLVRHSPS